MWQKVSFLSTRASRQAAVMKMIRSMEEDIILSLESSTSVERALAAVLVRMFINRSSVRVEWFVVSARIRQSTTGGDDLPSLVLQFYCPRK